MIESAEVRKVIKLEISITKLMALQDELHAMKQNDLFMNNPNTDDFYLSLTNMLKEKGINKDG